MPLQFRIKGRKIDSKHLVECACECRVESIECLITILRFIRI